MKYTNQEKREKSPMWMRFMYTMERWALAKRRDPLETAYDHDYVVWSNDYSLAAQKYQDSERLLKETDDKGLAPF